MTVYWAGGRGSKMFQLNMKPWGRGGVDRRNWPRAEINKMNTILLISEFRVSTKKSFFSTERQLHPRECPPAVLDGEA